MTPPTAPDTDAIRQRLEKKTKDPVACRIFYEHAPADIAFLLREVERLKRENEECWQAAERSAIERAAKVAEEIEVMEENDHGAANTGGAGRVARAIRSLLT